MLYINHFIKYYFILLLLVSCSKNENNFNATAENVSKELTIFHINDQHGSLANFSKIKNIIDKEKEKRNVMVVCGGDIFSGNPVVDNHNEKGFPMIDLMNKVGFDISVLGNHEFDYGEAILKDRVQQSQFEWVCANVNMNSTGIPEPYEYKTITKNNVKVTFLGLIETYGKENATIPSTHPWRVQNLTFEDYKNVAANYSKIKEDEQSDLFIALTHLGNSSDKYLAKNFRFFDIIIGGHSHSINNEVVNNIPIFQAGSNLNYLGKLELVIKNKSIETLNYKLIDLKKHSDYDTSLNELINNYNKEADLDEVIGFSESYHSKTAVGGFYTDVLRMEMNVDISIQNTGGVRNTLDEGDILKREIFSIDPFNNGSVTYSMTVKEIKDFLKGSKAAIYYSGIKLVQENGTISIFKNQQELNDNTSLTIGLNDYIPAVYDQYFTQNPNYRTNTTAETIINYLENSNTPINYTQTNNYFKFQ